MMPAMPHSLGLFPMIIALALAGPAGLRSFDEFPETVIDYYSVSATTADGLREQMRQRGPNNGGTNDATARAYYTFDWSATTRDGRTCDAKVSIHTRIRFPRHSNPAAMTPPMRAEWTRFIRELESHEVGHIALAYDALPKLKAAIESGSCSGAQARAGKVDDELRRRQEAFDNDARLKVMGLRSVE